MEIFFKPGQYSTAYIYSYYKVVNWKQFHWINNCYQNVKMLFFSKLPQLDFDIDHC
jgi:hypothetical protein